MNEYKLLYQTKRIGTALAFIFYPILAGIAFAVHPNLLSLDISHDIQERINEFHGNQILHFGHMLMVVAVPLLIVIAIHFVNLLQRRGAWWGFVGGILAVTGAVILAVDKGALCLVPSAFDTLPETQFRALVPGIEAMFQYKGWLWILQLLPLLPLGFILQSTGLVISKEISRKQSVPMLIGSVLMANPDIDLIGLVATIVLAIGFIPYAIQLIQSVSQVVNQSLATTAGK
ncbi:MAG: hypothetical protein K8R77_10190 [Anaerolineaceae bacterium]|nr:hypothetical protein [Anaerolineaceae bacterium]